MAQLIVYWVEMQQVPAEIGETLYDGMAEELVSRGKRLETDPDEEAMKSRWVKQLLSRELDLTREALQHGAEEPLAHLEVDFDMQEPQQESLAMESSKWQRRCRRSCGTFRLPLAVAVSGGKIAVRSRKSLPERSAGTSANLVTCGATAQAKR